MAAVRVYWSNRVAPWARYAYGIAALCGLLVPRSAGWVRRFWLRSRLAEHRLPAHLARSTATT